MILMFLFAIAGYSPIIFLGKEARVTQEMCTANGVPDLYQQVQNEYKQALSCSTDHLISRFRSGDDLNPYFKSKCVSRSKSQNCTANAISLSKQCLNTQDIKLLETWEKIDEQLLDYVCTHYFEILFAFDIKKFQSWIDANKVLSNCSQKMYNAIESESYRSMNKFTHSDFQDVEICLNTHLSKYSNEQVKDIVLTAINIIGSNVGETTTDHVSEHKRLRRSVILRRIVREIGVANKLHRIEHKVKNLCILNGHASEKLEEALEKMKKCSDEKKMFLVPKQEYLHHMEKCSNEAIKLFESCLPEKYKYLPPLFFKIVESMIGFLYDDFMIITSQLGPCIPKLNSKESTEEYNKCVDKILIEEELVDSKEKFCQNWIPINACYIKQIQKDCKHSEELTKFENDFTEAITKPCKSK